MKTILNNPKALACLHNIMKACKSEAELAEWLFEVYYRNFGSKGCPSLVECRELVKTRKVVLAAEFTQLPWNFYNHC